MYSILIHTYTRWDMSPFDVPALVAAKHKGLYWVVFGNRRLKAYRRLGSGKSQTKPNLSSIQLIKVIYTYMYICVCGRTDWGLEQAPCGCRWLFAISHIILARLGA